ncbi:hypothetical protein RvY_16318 [Ramazzottius varieornatus]|uniref:Uncharacterized protein n=1 Tax=Ramazzottius varieornatus TaxID=947166 RepID=A0A1D1W4H8_RAMVA|nr:hypothetical protein RvY_16318 [Ramazzottius varieornatus]
MVHPFSPAHSSWFLLGFPPKWCHLSPSRYCPFRPYWTIQKTLPSKPLWHRLCENILVDAYNILSGNFASRNQLLRTVQPIQNLPTRSQDKTMMLSPVSTALSSRSLLNSNLGSFVYITQALLQDRLSSPTVVDTNTFGTFEKYLGLIELLELHAV